MALAQPIALGRLCASCLRLTGQAVRMEVYPTCYFCPNCKQTHPTRRERGRMGLMSELRAAGFFLLLLSSVVYSTFGIQSELVWVGFLAGYSFYFLNILGNTKEILFHV